MNENFQSKVANIPGALDLMLAAGFALASVVDEKTSQEELYLKHDMSSTNEPKLDYTIHRYCYCNINQLIVSVYFLIICFKNDGRLTELQENGS